MATLRAVDNGALGFVSVTSRGRKGSLEKPRGGRPAPPRTRLGWGRLFWNVAWAWRRGGEEAGVGPVVGGGGWGEQADKPEGRGHTQLWRCHASSHPGEQKTAARALAASLDSHFSIPFRKDPFVGQLSGGAVTCDPEPQGQRQGLSEKNSLRGRARGDTASPAMLTSEAFLGSSCPSPGRLDTSMWRHDWKSRPFVEGVRVMK